MGVFAAFVLLFHSRPNAIHIDQLLARAYTIREDCPPQLIVPATLYSFVALTSSTISSSSSASPQSDPIQSNTTWFSLPDGGFPVFSAYPRMVVDCQLKEREMIRIHEEEVLSCPVMLLFSFFPFPCVFVVIAFLFVVFTKRNCNCNKRFCLVDFGLLFGVCAHFCLLLLCFSDAVGEEACLSSRVAEEERAAVAGTTGLEGKAGHSRESGMHA